MITIWNLRTLIIAIGDIAMPIFMWEYSNVKNFWRQYTNITKHGGQFLAGQGANGGYSFLNDGGHDTGIYSDADGDLYFKKNNIVYRFSTPNGDETISSQKTVTGAIRVINCGGVSKDSFGNWPLYLQAIDANAVRNGARAGIAFHNPGESGGVLFLQGGQLHFCDNGGQFFTINMTKH